MRIPMSILAASAALVPVTSTQAASTAGRYDTTMGRSRNAAPPHAAVTILCAAPETGNAAIIASLGDPGDGGGTENLELVEYDFYHPEYPDIRRTQIALGENDGGAETRRYPVLRRLSPEPSDTEKLGWLTMIDKGNVDAPALEDFQLVTEVVGASGVRHECEVGLQQRALSVSMFGVTRVSQATVLGGTPIDDTFLYFHRWEDRGNPKAALSLRVQAIAEDESDEPSAFVTFLAVDDEGAVASMTVSRSFRDTVGWTWFSRTEKAGAPNAQRHLADQASFRPAEDYRNVAVVGTDLPDLLWRLERCSDWRAHVEHAPDTPPPMQAYTPEQLQCDTLASELDTVRARYADRKFATRALGVWSFEEGRPVSRLWTR